MAECPHGLDESWCSVCLHGPTRAPALEVVTPPFRAQFEGDCASCDLAIDVGERIVRLSNDTYVHAGGCEP